MAQVKITNAQGVENLIDESQFELCQTNANIHDQKFETKTTTYMKDAFKRFCKNKSSVVAAIIIGILLILAFSVPIFSKHDLKVPHLDQRLLSPRVFKPGTGFWDGTKTYKHVIYDPVTEAPAGYKANAVVKYVEKVDKILNDASQYAYGGDLIFEASKGKKSENDYYFDYFKNKTEILFTQENDITLTVDFSDLEKYQSLNRPAEYRILLLKKSTVESYEVLVDWTTEIEDYEINISDFLKEKSIDSYNGYIRFDVKVTDLSDTVYNALYFNSILLTTGLDPEVEENQELITKLEQISIDDATFAKLRTTDSIGYWQSTGTSRTINAHVTYVTFVYDHYEDQLGFFPNYEIGKSEMLSYIEKGYCEYDFKVGPESFKKLSDRCPIETVNSQKESELNGKEIVILLCDVYKYKYLNFDKMPKFILGTDASGYDLCTRAFSSLRTSLGVAIIISGVCFIFGLCWGAISGYFGGNIDLAMERFCEILGGMPYIVLMTLALIKWGNSIFTFAIASCITGWMGTAGITRTQFYRFKGREYILSSRTLGSSDIRLIFKHILPNAMGTIVTSSVLRIPGVIFSEATLSYLGLGLQGVQSFGVILSSNQQYINSYAYLILFPAAIISLLMISFNLFGNGLRDALNPSLKGSD